MSGKTGSEALSIYWQRQIEGWQSSGQTQRAYCEANELSYHRFGYWRVKFRRQAQQAQSHEGSGFVPVIPVVPSHSAGLSLVLPRGLVLRGIAGDNLPVVYQLLSRLL